MTTYHSYGVSLSKGQKNKLAKAWRENSAITIRLTNNKLTGSDRLILTKTQINKLNKSKRDGTGSDIKISKSQIRKAVVEGGSILSMLPLLASKALH